MYGTCNLETVLYDDKAREVNEPLRYTLAIQLIV